MESSYHYHTILLFVCFAIIYAQSIRHSEFSIYKKKRIPFILYSSSFFITTIALIGMFIFRHDSDVFYLFMGLYLLGGLIKLIGKMIYAKLVKDEYLYKQHFTTFTPPRKLMKLVYTRPELSPLDFLRFGP